MRYLYPPSLPTQKKSTIHTTDHRLIFLLQHTYIDLLPLRCFFFPLVSLLCLFQPDSYPPHYPSYPAKPPSFSYPLHLGPVSSLPHMHTLSCSRFYISVVSYLYLALFSNSRAVFNPLVPFRSVRQHRYTLLLFEMKKFVIICTPLCSSESVGHLARSGAACDSPNGGKKTRRLRENTVNRNSFPCAKEFKLGVQSRL